MQTTLKREITLVGMGLHSGRPARMVLRPATTGGIRFRRVDVTDRDNLIPARFDRVTDTRLCTLLSNEAGVSLGTVEHVMAALAGTGVTHALIDIDGPEVPIMDGSSLRFVRAILRAGLRALPGDLVAIRVLAPVREGEGDVWAELRPAETLSIDFEIDFADAAIGHQARRLSMVNGAFVHELADCRTFCRRVEVETMQANGLALGGSLDNAIVVEGDKVLNPGGLRRADEFVRHKMLDALGDLALAGAPILGAYKGVKAGHGVTNRLLRKLFATPGAYEIVTLDAEAAQQLPGAGVGAADLRRAG
ncbi:UDP-3-O-acyl-N-acetylglucosamine deacetylase [Amaricoccus sp.]|uniref:UDP-3-O-acyl-N-acetylglucosamine deacetylase n=1 Tax=Amaricoccus sp. TaxID=1872485 RepID=UPI002605EE06|nr:UDP-3-O-acyl-N-acetylglucosamine deacetylase [Amaricoccus sp.]HRO11543.1 UDP-3-O-acyl-N-acetylglucosamine deacetylase [Amaricoccus sp.]